MGHYTLENGHGIFHAFFVSKAADLQNGHDFRGQISEVLYGRGRLPPHRRTFRPPLYTGGGSDLCNLVLRQSLSSVKRFQSATGAPAQYLYLWSIQYNTHLFTTEVVYPTFPVYWRKKKIEATQAVPAFAHTCLPAAPLSFSSLFLSPIRPSRRLP